jgi:hypothetical protein
MRDKQRTARAALAALALTAVAVAGCGGGATTPTVASLAGHHGSAGSGSGGLTEAQGDADMVQFTSCMRAHGVQMADPYHRPGHVGLTIAMPARDSGTEVAFRACLHFIQPIINMKERGAAEKAAPYLPALTRYAECMRAHGIDMLDPTPQGALNLGHVPGINYSFGRYSPQFRAADARCRHVLPAFVRDDGTGP